MSIRWYETKMTSNNAPTPYVISASGVFDVNYSAWKAFNGTSSGETDAWVTPNGVITGWIQIDFGRKIEVNALKLIGRFNPNTNRVSEYAKNFNILGSNDGVSFATIGSFINIAETHGETKTFKFINTVYRYYRVEVQSNNGLATYTSIGDISFGLVTEKSLIEVDDKYYSYADNMSKYGVSHFKFDESSGNVTDSKGSAIGTIAGATRAIGYNGEGNALSFNGTNNYVTFNQKIVPVGRKSVRFKIKTAMTIAGYVITNVDTFTSHYGIAIYINAEGKIFLSIGKANVTPLLTIASNTKINDNQWHDILFTWDGTTSINGIKVYVDDMVTPNNMGKSDGLETTNPSNNLVIGRLGTGGVYFNGQLDGLEIYNEVIDPNKSEITLLDQDTFDSSKENNFINYGMPKGLEVDLMADVNKIVLPKSTSTALDTGKVFKQKIDASKHPIKSVSIT